MKTGERMGIPPRRENVFYVRSPKGLETFKFTIYSELVEPVYTHYHGKRTVPCYKNHDLCEGGHSILNLRWKGYLFGWTHEENKLEWLQLTHEAANQLADQLEGAQPFRGITIQVSRTKSKQGRMNVRLIDSWQTLDVRRIRKPPCVRISLFNLWKLTPNNHPFSTCLEDVQLGGDGLAIVG